MDPTPAYFDIIPARMMKTKSQKNAFICICGRRNALALFASTQSACVQTRFRCMKNRIITEMKSDEREKLVMKREQEIIQMGEVEKRFR